ncbi:MAG: hypothetical protein ACOX6U_08455 [Oscillospiraceae bacterium]|jgi:hypothetical protein
MQIYVKEKGRIGIWIGLPTRFICNLLVNGRIGRKILSHIDFSKIQLSKEGIERLCSELLRMKKKYPRLILVDVVTRDGERILVRL